MTGQGSMILYFIMKTIKEFTETFNTEDNCIDFLIHLYGKKCRHCGHEKTYELNKKGWFKCASCGKKSSVRIGTIFQDSRLPLTTWFLAIFLLSNAKKGMSSVELGEKLGVTQKTAWFMYHRIRKTYNEILPEFTGITEADEAYVGGKEKNKHTNKKKAGSQGGANKMVVVGMIDRESNKVKAKHIPDSKANTLMLCFL